MDIKTVDDSKSIISDSIDQKQKEILTKMRTAFLSLSDDSGFSVKTTMQSIAVMQLYHQLARIIRYTEIMDKLESKLYESMEYSIENSDSSDTNTIVLLMGIQEKLQKSMIESYKLLQPYIENPDIPIDSIADSEPDNTVTKQIMSPEDRDKLRAKAQSILYQLQMSGGDSGGDDDK